MIALCFRKARAPFPSFFYRVLLPDGFENIFVSLVRPDLNQALAMQSRGSFKPRLLEFRHSHSFSLSPLVLVGPAL